VTVRGTKASQSVTFALRTRSKEKQDTGGLKSIYSRQTSVRDSYYPTARRRGKKVL